MSMRCRRPSAYPGHLLRHFQHDGFHRIFSPPFNQNTLPLIVPGPQVPSTSVPAGTGSDNLITNGTTSTLNVTFDRPMQVSTFTPGQVLSIMGPTGSIIGPQYFPENSVDQTIPAATATTPGTLNSTLTVPNYNGTFKVADLTVQLDIAGSSDANLSAVLIAPDGRQDPPVRDRGHLRHELHQHDFDDAAETSITNGTALLPGRSAPAVSCRV